MGKPIIEINGISKKYKLGEMFSYGNLREEFTNSVKGIFKGKKETEKNTLWALKDVSFSVNEGEVVGIIGRNGAGKSTLLKILSRITDPTEGEIKLRGRVASLLEVGTGFHPELTGRENVFFNGALLGMTRGEIKKKFDEIVAFAEIEKFIDTPVKRYSSGMYVRLAFAVAAHLDPEILIVDEVLAVGDASFQKKCLGKMSDVAKGGRTVLFVSHNMQAVNHLCSKGVILHQGKVISYGDIDATLSKYLSDMNLQENIGTISQTLKNQPRHDEFRMLNVSVMQDGIDVGEFVHNGTPIDIEIEYEVFKTKNGLRVFIDLLDEYESLLIRSFNDEDNDHMPTVEPGIYKAKVSIPANILAPKIYYLRIQATIYGEKMLLDQTGINVILNVEHTGKYNRAYYMEPVRSKFAFALPWENTKER